MRYDDPDGHDKLYRFAESIQEYFDLSAGLDFVYPDGVRATGACGRGQEERHMSYLATTDFADDRAFLDGFERRMRGDLDLSWLDAPRERVQLPAAERAPRARRSATSTSAPTAGPRCPR